MSGGPTLARLLDDLAAGRIVPLADEDWRELRGSFTLVDSTLWTGADPD